MQKIKYHQLINNENEPMLTEYNSNQRSLMHYLQECKRHFLLKLFLACILFVNAFYVINNYTYQTYLNYNTTVLFENTTSLHEATSEQIFIALLKNEEKNLTEWLSYNTSHRSTTVGDNNYVKTTTPELKIDGATDTHYDNVDFTKTKLISDSAKYLKTTTIFNLTSTESKEETSTTKTPTSAAVFANETLLKTKEIITGAHVANITATKTLNATTILPSTAAAATSEAYFINTSHCHIPFVEPYTSEILKIFKPQNYTGCTKDQPIVTSSFDDLTGHYILRINYTVAQGLEKSSKGSKPIEEDLLCCYKQVVRSGSGANVDTSFKLLPCTNFHQNFVVPSHIDGIILNCKSKSQNITLQEDALAFVQINKTVKQNTLNTKSIPRKLSVLMIGIDTLSRINFRRNMPQMFKYLVKNEWFELMGYNKVGDNTLPNLMPLLSGYTSQTVYERCHPKKVGGFDNCNFIWNTFRKNGYHTAYAEDSTTISTFNYHMKGFKEPPTDYYFRPMALAIEKSLKSKTMAGLKYCLGRRQFGEYIYDYGTEFVSRFKNESSFGFFWTNSFSHNSYDISATMDTKMVNYFKEWGRLGVLQNSLVMFFSDHGARWGPLLKLSQGFLEERLPMFFISVPKWFQKENPQLMKNLKINQKRLTNPFDVHMTLQHILKLADHNYKVQQTVDCPQCRSIFEEIPENRTCYNASIPEAWCTCIQFKKESTKNEEVLAVTNLIIDEMNQYYKRKNLTSLCSPLQLHEVTNAKWRYKDDSIPSDTVLTYAIDFTTDPITKPKALFSASVDYDRKKKSISLNVEDISRQSLYESTAKCTDDAQVKKYCICKNSLK